MEIFNSINDFRAKKQTGQFFAKPGLVISNGFFHLGLAHVLKKLVEECDLRTLVVRKPREDFYMVSEFLDKLKPFNLDNVIFIDELPEVMTFEVTTNYVQFTDYSISFYFQIFNIIKPRYFFIGQKDFFEAKLISELILDFAYDITLEVIQNVRDSNGVLCSASFEKLEDQYLPDVYALNRSIDFIGRMIQNGQKEVEKLKKLVEEYVLSFKNFKLVKLVFIDAATLSEIRYIESDKKIFIQIEGTINGTEFVDNCLI
jgi:hypothetical protein